jgi:hypothetical protein
LVPRRKAKIPPPLCRYCRAPFQARSTGGTEQRFCKPACRKAYDRYGRKSFARQASRIQREVNKAIEKALKPYLHRLIMLEARITNLELGPDSIASVDRGDYTTFFKIKPS